MIISRVDAQSKGLTRYFNGNPCIQGHVCERLTSNCICVICHTKAKRENKRKSYRANPNKFRQLGRLDYKKNSFRYKLAATIRQKRVKVATPKWVTKEIMKPFYLKRDQLSLSSGVPHDVDHIYPLTPKDGLYCGLNVPANLQIIPSSENRSKQNRWFGRILEQEGVMIFPP